MAVTIHDVAQLAGVNSSTVSRVINGKATITPDTKQGGLRFSWLTDPAVTKTVIQYKVKGASKWESKSGTSYVESVTAGYSRSAEKRCRCHSIPSWQQRYRPWKNHRRPPTKHSAGT